MGGGLDIFDFFGIFYELSPGKIAFKWKNL